MTSALPSFSIVMPVYNGAPFLAQSLGALLTQARPDQIVVVDDLSEDDSADVARSFGVNVVALERQSGAAAARNRGARELDTDVLVFVDADVVALDGSVDALVRRLGTSGAAAVFGSYDDKPADAGLVSQYVNLRHHYTHHQAAGEASSFWSGFGAVRRHAFEEAGGFDPDYPGIEDIALGYRLRALGHRIVLDPSIQARHLKRWTLWSMIRTDVFMRAVPWSRLRTAMPGSDSLNLTTPEKARAAAALLPAPLALAALAGLAHWSLPAASLLIVALANLPIERFFYRKRGLAFAIAASALHQLYYNYAAAAFAGVGITRRLERILGGGPSFRTGD